jgi:Zn-dependent protease with chaperone function
MREVPSRPRSRRRLAGAVLFLLVLAAVAIVVLPVWLIRPFAPQTPAGVAVAYALRRWAAVGTVLALFAGFGIAAWLWRGGRWWSRMAVALAFVVLAVAAWGAHWTSSMFETMFAPLAKTASVPAAEARWVEEGDPVLAVELNDDAAAYPVRQIAYHHVVNDVVGGVPVAVTY